MEADMLDQQGGPIYGLALCAGAGGLELGLSIALGERYRCICYVEREAYAAGVIVARMADAALAEAPVWDDVGTFDGRPWRGLVDILSAGYPCQPFSVAGRQLGAGDERWIWPDIRRIVAEVEPAACFFENVGGHLRHGYFDVVRPDLESLGYGVTEGLFTAAEVGAPHDRERLFVLAYRQGGGLRSGGGAPGIAGQPNGGGALVADAEDSDGRPGSQSATGRQRFGRGGPSGAGAGARRVFPPGPADGAGWRAWNARHPGSEPAIRRNADGLAYRLDRLRLCGNGVVPLQAAYAFWTLAATTP